MLRKPMNEEKIVLEWILSLTKAKRESILKRVNQMTRLTRGEMSRYTALQVFYKQDTLHTEYKRVSSFI